MPLSDIIFSRSGSDANMQPCSMESTPASMAVRSPGPPRAWQATVLPWVWASSTSAWVSAAL